MRLLFVFYFFLFSITSAYSQSEFQMDSHKKKVVVPFHLINNLIFIPIKVNGEELTFLLDTGVDETILFSLDDKEQIKFFEIEKIKLKGLGSKEAVDAYKSSNNRLDANGFIDVSHEIYLVLDQEFNFSSQVGIPVNGIIGYHFFKNHKVEIDYERKKIIIYNDLNPKIDKVLRRSYTKSIISIEENKPYFISNIRQNKKEVSSKLLLDTGNSDALWIFLKRTNELVKPEVTINDFLGRGFSGEIFGLRGRITNFDFGGRTFEKPIVTFPDSVSIKSVNFVPNRIGSIGGEVLSRFTLIFDYKNNYIYTKANQKINEPFAFNMSGIEVEHAGLEWTKQQVENSGIKVYSNVDDERVRKNLQVKFELKPIFKVASVRPESNAEKAGVKKGDRIISINSRVAHELTIERINELLKSEEGKTIRLEVERNGINYNYKFLLKSIL